MEASAVLVVEDDVLVRLCAVEMLEDAGFVIVEARHADEAWFILHERSDIGELFTDVDMPGTMCRMTLAGRVHEAWPGIRLVVTSGRQRLDYGEIPDHGLFVSKPYSADQVIDAIHNATGPTHGVVGPHAAGLLWSERRSSTQVRIPGERVPGAWSTCRHRPHHCASWSPRASLRTPGRSDAIA